MNVIYNFIKSVIVLLFVIYILILGTKFCFGESSCFFTWDQNIESDLAGYKMYRANDPNSFIFGTGSEVGDIPVENVELDPNNRVLYDLENIPDGENFFAVTAYDENGNESGPSNIVSDIFDTTAPNSPNSLKKKGCLPIF